MHNRLAKIALSSVQVTFYRTTIDMIAQGIYFSDAKELGKIRMGQP